MTQTHTPGPWRKGQHDNITSRDGDIIAQVYRTSFPSDGLPPKEITANARLIAAAPELLAELKDACASLELQAATARHYAAAGQNAASNFGLADELERNARRHRAVIAKAESCQ